MDTKLDLAKRYVETEIIRVEATLGEDAEKRFSSLQSRFLLLVSSYCSSNLKTTLILIYL
jgi:hypothetical protein